MKTWKVISEHKDLEYAVEIIVCENDLQKLLEILEKQSEVESYRVEKI